MLAALFKYIAQQDWEVGICSRTEIGAIHFIGKLIEMRLNYPLNIYLPSFLSNSVPADLNLAVTA
jgi:hypothetical protein